MYFCVTALKGDLKFMTQCLNLVRHSGREQVAWKLSVCTIYCFIFLGVFFVVEVAKCWG